MNVGLILLLTLDPQVEAAMADALLETGDLCCLAHTADEAMRMVRAKNGQLGLAVIDFDHGSNSMTIMSAIDACSNHHLPMVALTGPGEEHARSVALANGTAECLAKPVSAAQLANAMINCGPKWEFAQVA